MKVLLLENISQVAKETLENAGHQVLHFKENIESPEVVQHLESVQLLGIRSRSGMTKEVIEKCPNLEAIGCFCIGTNQVNLAYTAKKGIAVFNAPFSNTRSVAEMVLAEIIVLSRKIHIRNAQLHRGEWQKSAEFSHEVRGKTLGIIGYGRIGSQLGILAENLGMNVIYYDIERKLSLGNALQYESLPQVFAQSDFISLHVPQTQFTTNMITQKELSQMKEGVHLINASRGNVIVIEDLLPFLESGHVASVAIDVFPIEPKDNSSPFISPLKNYENALLTPHIGGSTLEAQRNIAFEVCEKLLDFSSIGTTEGSVNVPNASLQVNPASKARLLHMHTNTPGMLEKINNILAQDGININSQILQTDGTIGYVISEISAIPCSETIAKLQAIPNTIRAKITVPKLLKPAS